MSDGWFRNGERGSAWVKVNRKHSAAAMVEILPDGEGYLVRRTIARYYATPAEAIAAKDDEVRKAEEELCAKT